jgi:putative FmdB family regulatory protein
MFLSPDCHRDDEFVCCAEDIVMPIYGFECESCGHQFDRLQKLSDTDPTHCPSCEKETLRRQLTAPQFRLAGAGWYETDFKKEGDKKRNLADSSDSKSEAKSESSSESKAEAKSETKTEAAPAAKAEAKPAAPSSGASST